MTATVKNVLIVSAVVVAGYLAYKWYQKRHEPAAVPASTPLTPAPGSATTPAPAAGTASQITAYGGTAAALWGDLSNILGS